MKIHRAIIDAPASSQFLVGVLGASEAMAQAVAS